MIVFLAALAPRLTLAWITLGSTDISNCFRNTTWILSGQQPVLPYLPGVELLIWFGGLFAHYTSVPPAFAYKLIPLLFDCAIALLLRDARSFRAGLLYAIAPVPIIITCMHGQWDSIFLYFLMLALVLAEDGREVARGLAGAAWVLSIIPKPVALPLLPLFLPSPRQMLRSKEARQRAFLFVSGATVCGLMYVCTVFALDYIPGGERLVLIYAYGGAGSGFFGLPWLAVVPLARYWTLLPTLAIMAMVWMGKMRRDEGVLLFFVLAMVNGMLAPQYLCWLVPFALLSGRYRFAAVYLLIAGVFLTLFYRAVYVNEPSVVFVGAYALLDSLAWLTPPPVSMTVSRMLAAIGNYVLPLLCLGYAIYAFLRGWRRCEPTAARSTPLLAVTVPAVVLLSVVTLAGIWAAAQPPVAPGDFVDRILRKVEVYDVVLYHGRKEDIHWVPRRMAQPRTANPVLNLSTILLALVAVSSVATWMTPGTTPGMTPGTTPGAGSLPGMEPKDGRT
jgi:hypothetical protein